MRIQLMNANYDTLLRKVGHGCYLVVLLHYVKSDLRTDDFIILIFIGMLQRSPMLLHTHTALYHS